MNSNGWVNFEDLLKSCGYTNSSKNDNDNDNENKNENNPGCNDIPNGFQTLYPELFVLIGELLGNIIAGNLPFNVQNVIGNWFELIGQAILVFNAQQQYFESGPGNFFDPRNFNSSNSSCSTNTNSTNSNSQSTTTNSSSTSNTSTSSKSSSSKSNDINISKLEELEKQVQELTNELNKIKILLQE